MFMNISLTVPIILGETLLHVTIARPIYMYNLYFICYEIKILLNDFSINIKM
jgi:hypothetical protein